MGKLFWKGNEAIVILWKIEERRNGSRSAARERERERGFLSSGSQWMLKLRVLTSTEMFHFYSPPWSPVSSIPLCFSLSLVSVSSIDLRNFPEYYTGVSFPEFFFSLKRDPFHFSPLPTTSLLHFPTPPCEILQLPD